MLLSIKNLHKKFNTEAEDVIIFNDFSLNVLQGESLAITGESGSGKSTLLNLIAKLDSFNQGKIFFEDTDIGLFNENQTSYYRNQDLGFIFQFHFLLKDFNVLENVALNALIGGLNEKDAKEKSAYLLNEVGLSDKVKYNIAKLSGGERQRVAIARSLINDPKLILADEPTGSLDEKNCKAIQNLLFTLTAKKNCSLLLVTHDKVLASLASRQIHLKKYSYENNENYEN